MVSLAIVGRYSTDNLSLALWLLPAGVDTMKTLLTILFTWCVLMLCLASFKIGYEVQLDASWRAYADQWVADHE